MVPPLGGALVRMYRIGHGDCFLIAFAGKDPKKPSFVLIDCGYKPGSPKMMARPTSVDDIAADIAAVTGGRIDLAIITHEHQDHLNGAKAVYPALDVSEAWFAWTESPDDDVARALRARFKDRLLGLLDKRAGFIAQGLTGAASDQLEEFLELELGDDINDYSGRTHTAAKAKDPAASDNKRAMKLIKDKVASPRFLYPHQKPRLVPGTKSVRAYVLGPPHDADKIDDLDPTGDEVFGKDDGPQGMAAANGGPAQTTTASPFPDRYVIALEDVAKPGMDLEVRSFFATYYGPFQLTNDPELPDGKEVATNAAWRRLTTDDMADAGALALAMNNATNNASLVLAFELSPGGKVLLFAGDAQAGNWRSWSEGEFTDGDVSVTSQDLLRRSVLYKVGHHGSHNATLNGKADSKHPSLAWMAQGNYAGEFVAMITAVEKWAHQKPKPNWNHPLPAIKEALVEKAGGRLLQTDSELPSKPVGTGAAHWQAFLERVKQTDLYFDLVVEP